MKLSSETTRLEFVWCNARVRLEVTGTISKRMRRTILLFFYSRIARQVEKVEHRILFHLDRTRLLPKEELEQGISLHQAPRTTSQEGLLGFEIRIRRLELGLSQLELAQKAQLSRSHISRIEKGHLRANPHTLQKLCLALKPKEKTIFSFGIDGIRKHAKNPIAHTSAQITKGGQNKTHTEARPKRGFELPTNDLN